jgi:predicted flap endonuclease-1-like 5' DNA nuclease
VLAALRAEVAALRSARDGEARRLEGRISDLERLLPEMWRRGRRIEELEKQLAAAEDARHAAEATATLFRDELKVLRTELEAERERAARLAGDRFPALPADPYRIWERRFRERRDGAFEEERAAMSRRITAQREVIEEKEARIAYLAALVERLRPPEGPDDLTRISGIGPAIQRILASEDITSFDQVAALTPADIRRIGALLPVYPGRIDDDRWVEQARALADERDRTKSGAGDLP